MHFSSDPHKAKIAGRQYATRFYVETVSRGNPLEPTNANLVEILKGRLHRCPAWCDALRRELALRYGVTVAVERIIAHVAHGGASAGPPEEIAFMLSRRVPTQLMDDYRETQRIGGEDARKVRRWITTELTANLGREAVLAFEQRAANEAKERAINARDARKGDVYVTRGNCLYVRRSITDATTCREGTLVQLTCEDGTTPLLDAGQRIIVERDQPEPEHQDAEEENRAALGRDAEEEADARQAQSWDAEVDDLNGELDDSEQYEHIDAGDIQVGDRVARARTHPFVKVAAIRHGSTAVRLLNEHGATIARPQKTASWWRIAEKRC